MKPRRNYTTAKPPGLRLATEDDFRKNNQLVLKKKYWFYHFGTQQLEPDYTHDMMDIKDFKNRIYNGDVYVLIDD